MINETGNHGDEGFKDPMVFQARRRAAALGVDPDFGEALVSATSLEDVRNHSIRMGIQGAGHHQILAITFHALYQRDPGLLSKSKAVLEPIIQGWGLPENVVEWYTTRPDDPSLNFTLEYESVLDAERRNKFTDAAEDFMLKSVKEYLLTEA